MDFLHRSANNQPQPSRNNGAGQGPAASVAGGVSKVKSIVDVDQPKWLRIVFVVLLFSATILLLAIAVLFWSGRAHEGELVDNTKKQAVFLTNGQVYFGQVKDINSQFVDLQDIYYLNSQSQSTDNKETTAAPTSFSLVKLGCELHGPTDRMVINRDQVSFWENLSSDGKVAKAIDQWKSENPNGLKCDNTTNSTQQSTGTTGTGTESTDGSSSSNN
ncbi:MAG TPA: hypothetical protein VLA92_00215 [Candidatus Saccharimonadales bacterium]|nr:hypothetical protein [Candidatus Saccharimonadales bacterium]